MAELAAAALVKDLETAVQSGSSERRVEMLRKMTDLFLSDADRLNEQQIKVFDDVLLRMMERIEARTLAQLSDRIADVGSAPREVVRQLAYHNDVEVAGPVLSRSTRLSERDLVTIASNAEQGHLLAISSRTRINEAVTDALIRRGDNIVSTALAKNDGARFSERGYATLVESAEGDAGLAESLGLRLDIPPTLLRELLSKAAAAVRDRLMKVAPPELREKISAAIQAIAGEVKIAKKAVDYTEAQNAVQALNRAGNLSDAAVGRFAQESNYKNVIAAMALLSSTSIDAIEPVVNNPRPDGLIVACKASGLSWPTTNVIIRNRKNCPPASREELEQGRSIFNELSLAAAQRTMRFWSARGAAKKPDVGAPALQA
jgi:uncharacterized protein (DUF2336 family)